MPRVAMVGAITTTILLLPPMMHPIPLTICLLSSSINLPSSGTLSGDLDSWDVNEHNNGIGNEDDFMEPAPNSASEHLSKPALEGDIAKLKQQCASTP